ncbi:mediator of RNA polymerase II transcription subunit 1-domain-containing protein [Peziza echinospora]|nr:mediator of RNA polymerase II transcription subunit 1-domain-containing protein [Peziza echinospora]
MTTPKPPGMATPKPQNLSTPKPPGMTPGPLSNFTFSPANNSPAGSLSHQLRQHRGSPANVPLTFTPNSAAAAEVVAQLGNYVSSGGHNIAVRTPAFLQNQIGLPPDENKKRELEEILRTLATVPGRISIEGIERLAKRLGLECWKENDSTLSVVGTIIVVDIDFTGNNITQVALTFANTPGPSNDLAPLAAAILKKNLQPNKPLLISSLKDFAGNLERLSKLDKLSQVQSTNCFTAITGLYSSLAKIFDHERKTMEGGVMDATCKGNGRPRMHYAGKVGLSVEYWRLRRKMMATQQAEDQQSDPLEEAVASGEGMWRVIIEVDELGPECSTLDPVRTSDNWVNIKPSEDSMFGDEYVIDWLDPEPTVENLMEVDSHRGAARFIARLDPPIIVPLLDEVTIFTNLGLYSPPGQIGPTTLDGLLFPGHAQLGQELAPLTAVRRVYLPDHLGGGKKGKGKGREKKDGGGDGDEEDEDDGPSVNHRYTLHTLKPIYAREVWEVPFAHPKQLGPILQIFRQYVLVTTLLKSCFKTHNRPPRGGSHEQPASQLQLQPHTAPPPPPPPSSSPPLPPAPGLDDLDAFLASTPTPPPTSSSTTTPIPIDVSLSADPPTLVLIFPSHRTPGRLVNLEVEVTANAAVAARYVVVDTPEWVREHGVARAGVGGLVGEEAVTRMVEAGEELAVLVEWLRRRV